MITYIVQSIGFLRRSRSSTVSCLHACYLMKNASGVTLRLDVSDKAQLENFSYTNMSQFVLALTLSV